MLSECKFWFCTLGLAWYKERLLTNIHSSKHTVSVSQTRMKSGLKVKTFQRNYSWNCSVSLGSGLINVWKSGGWVRRHGVIQERKLLIFRIYFTGVFLARQDPHNHWPCTGCVYFPIGCALTLLPQTDKLKYKRKNKTFTIDLKSLEIFLG